ncbi:MAG: hypothetical protein ACE5J2_08855 [Nitrososphaerales archaeon]
MEEPAKQKVLERIISKLKENVVHSEEFLKTEATNPVDKKIDKLIQSVSSLIERDGTTPELKGSLSLILNGLENIRDNYRYFVNATGRASEDYNTYVYVLETLNKEYGNGASKPAEMVNEVRAEKALNEAPAQKPKPQKKVSESTEVKRLADLNSKSATGLDYRDWWMQEDSKEARKQKSGRFKFALHKSST